MLSASIQSDMLAAMKSGDQPTLSTLRMLRSALKNKEIDLQHPLTDEEVQAVIRAQIKQLEEARETYTSAGRTESAQEALREQTQLKAYLPKELSDEELTHLIKEGLAEAGVTDGAQAQKAMGTIMKKVAGRADGNRVKTLLMGMFALFGLLVVLHPATTHAAGFLDLFAPERVNAGVNYALNSPESIYIFLIRLARVLILFIGLSSITQLLRGGFVIMTASGREETHHSGMQAMMVGMMGTLFVFVTFIFSSVVLERLGQ